MPTTPQAGTATPASSAPSGFPFSSPTRSGGRASPGAPPSEASSRDSVKVSPVELPRLTLPARRPVFAHRSTTTHDVVQQAGFAPAPRVTLEEAAGPRPERRANLFGLRTRFKPFYLVGMGAAGNWLYGTGTVALERGLFPRRPVAPPGGIGPALPPVWEPLFGNRRTSLALGGASTAGGIILALASCGLFYQDARRLARKQGGANPSYFRPNAYFVAHLVGIGLSVGAKFTTEALRDLFTRDFTWGAVVPGQVGQALFAVTQAQAFSSCELANGKMPLSHRGEIGFAFRFFVGLYSLYGVLQGVPYVSSYGKEVVRLSAVTAATLAYSLPLTTARIERHARTLPSPATPEVGPKDSWHAMGVLAGYCAGRVLAGFGPDLLQRGVFVAASTHHFPSVAGPVFGGASMLAIGTGICVGAIMLFRQDAAAYDVRKANTWAALAFLSLILVETYRGIFEMGLLSGQRRLSYVSAVPGVLGVGLRLAVLPELWCYAELFRGTTPLRHRYQWTEASRAAAQMLFGIWGATCAIPGFDPFAREAIGIAAGIFATLGMALPTTTSRRALPQYAWPMSPGRTPGLGTPSGERGDPFALLPLPQLA